MRRGDRRTAAGRGVREAAKRAAASEGQAQGRGAGPRLCRPAQSSRRRVRSRPCAPPTHTSSKEEELAPPMPPGAFFKEEERSMPPDAVVKEEERPQGRPKRQKRINRAFI